MSTNTISCSLRRNNGILYNRSFVWWSDSDLVWTHVRLVSENICFCIGNTFRLYFRIWNPEPDSHIHQPCKMSLCQTIVEILVICCAVRYCPGSSPTRFRQGAKPRERLVFYKILRTVSEFFPESCLNSHHVSFCKFKVGCRLSCIRTRCRKCNRIIGIHQFQWDDPCPVMASFNRRLLHIQIYIFSCLHHAVESVLYSHRSPFLAVPYIDERIVLYVF